MFSDLCPSLSHIIFAHALLIHTLDQYTIKPRSVCHLTVSQPKFSIFLSLFSCSIFVVTSTVTGLHTLFLYDTVTQGAPLCFNHTNYNNIRIKDWDLIL